MLARAPLFVGLVALLLAGCPHAPTSTPCSKDVDCASGWYCQSGGCEPCPTCGANERCVHGTCRPVVCVDIGCSSSEGCVDGHCTSSDCVSLPCPAGKYCADGTCYPKDCDTQSCTAAEVCSQQSCVADPCAGVGGAGGRATPDCCEEASAAAHDCVSQSLG